MEEAKAEDVRCCGVCGDTGLPSTAQALTHWSETGGGHPRGRGWGMGQASRG